MVDGEDTQHINTRTNQLRVGWCGVTPVVGDVTWACGERVMGQEHVACGAVQAGENDVVGAACMVEVGKSESGQVSSSMVSGL